MRGADEFTRDDIEDLLATLGARLQARGVAATVYVVGGAAIVLRDLSSDRRTADIDALWCLRSPVVAAKPRMRRFQWCSRSTAGPIALSHPSAGTR